MKNIIERKVNGITMISLVVTIVVLLILAGISITAVTGNNNIIKNAQIASEESNKSEEKEIVKEAIVYAMKKNKYGNAEKQYVKEQLNKNSKVESVEEFTNGVEVRFKSSRTYVIATDGNVYNSREDVPINKTPEEIKEDNIKSISNIGKKVNFVSKYNNELIWRLFYEDNRYVYLISSKLDENNKEIAAQRTNYGAYGGLGLINQLNTSYTGSANITDEFLKSLNSKWHTYIENDANAQYRTSESAKSIAWFMDQNKWKNWKDEAGVAQYVIGGPTIELFFKSFNSTAESNSQTQVGLTIVNGGYDTTIETNRMIKHEYNNGIYHLDGETNSFWLASPGGNNNNDSDIGLRVRTSGGGSGRIYGIYFGQTGYNLGVRPVAILPMSAYIESDYHIIEE